MWSLLITVLELVIKLYFCCGDGRKWMWVQVKAAGVMGHKCCCKCKEIVGRVAAEVKAESEQWTEMQEMLDQVRLEMEGLKSSRDIWQSRAVTSELNLRSLYSRVRNSISFHKNSCAYC